MTRKVIEVAVSSLKFHPMIDKMIPRMRPKDWPDFLADVKERGILDPIHLAPDGETVLDGRHRVLAAREIGIKMIRAVIIDLEEAK